MIAANALNGDLQATTMIPKLAATLGREKVNAALNANIHKVDVM